MTAKEMGSSPVQQVRWVDRAAVVDVTGEIDLNCSSAFQEDLLAVLDKSPDRIVVNLTEVSYMDSSGVASLVKLLSRVRRHQIPLYLYGLTDRVKGVFEITRLDNVFEIHATEAEALG